MILGEGDERWSSPNPPEWSWRLLSAVERARRPWPPEVSDGVGSPDDVASRERLTVPLCDVRGPDQAAAPKPCWAPGPPGYVGLAGGLHRCVSRPPRPVRERPHRPLWSSAILAETRIPRDTKLIYRCEPPDVVATRAHHLMDQMATDVRTNDPDVAEVAEAMAHEDHVAERDVALLVSYLRWLRRE